MKMLENVKNSQEARELQIKEYEAELKGREVAIKEQEVQVKWMDAETRRFQAVSASNPEALSSDQIHDIAAGTVDAALDQLMSPPLEMPAPEPPPMQQPQQPMPEGPQAPPMM